MSQPASNCSTARSLILYLITPGTLCMNVPLVHNISGRKFAERRGLEDAERIDNDPPFILFQQKE